MKMQPFARRYCLLAYWLVFALLTLYYAQYHGLMLHPEQWRYPWDAVVAVCALLAILIGVLQLILRPASFHRSWARVLGALVYSGVLLAVGIDSVVTDMPGYYYVPALFSVVTMAGMLILVFFELASAFGQRS
jgi:hypothetical protein